MNRAWILAVVRVVPWVGVLLLMASPIPAGATDLDLAVSRVEPQVTAHRRWLHQHPELSNRETATARYLEKALRKLGLEVQTGIAYTGVVAVLRGGLPGPVVALRADMDGLPVTEDTELPFKSTARTQFEGREVGVMHACGHDGHMAILLGVAQLLSEQKATLAGTVKFIFQPAEESPPLGEEGGAELMVKEGVLSKAPQPEVIFGMHLLSNYEVGQVAYRSGGAMASADDMRIVVNGKQTHGAAPWLGVDPIVVAAQIVVALQTIPSRQLDSTVAPSIVTIGMIEGGLRDNIIPDRVEMKGTIRALDENTRKEIHQRVIRTAQKIAESAGASAEVFIAERHAYPVTYNDPALTARMLPWLRATFGEQLVEAKPILGAEDFSFFQREIPGLYLFVGIRPHDVPAAGFPSNHSPKFSLDEASLAVGVRALAGMTLDYLAR